MHICDPHMITEQIPSSHYDCNNEICIHGTASISWRLNQNCPLIIAALCL